MYTLFTTTQCKTATAAVTPPIYFSLAAMLSYLLILNQHMKKFFILVVFLAFLAALQAQTVTTQTNSSGISISSSGTPSGIQMSSFYHSYSTFKTTVFFIKNNLCPPTKPRRCFAKYNSFTHNQTS